MNTITGGGAGVNGAQPVRGLPKSILQYIPEPIQPLFENPLFSAGFGLLGVGSLVAIGRKGFQSVLIQGRRYFFVSVEVPSKDKSYHWLMDWLATKKDKTTRHVSVETTFHQHESGEIVSKINFIPSVGTHYVFYRGRVIKVERSREKNVIDMNSGNLWESITLTTLGTKRNIFQKLIEEAKIMALDKEEGKTIIYTSMGTEWRRFGHPRRKRPIGSVILDKGISETIITDVRKFLGNADWYNERGIPYRRGYLLYGPPGTGKSSFITALAGELQLSICILNLAGKGVSDVTLNQLLSTAPQRSIILLEDIDSAIQTNETNQPSSSSSNQSSNAISSGGMQYQGYSGPSSTMQYQGYGSSLTFSGLLNALDGVAASEGRILFMTTNHLEKLNKVLIRPGRVDLQIEIANSSPYQLEKMFLKFYPDHQELATQFVDKVKHLSLSPAQLQAYFMNFSTDPVEALENVNQLNLNK
ncbi:hypothetical protein DICPUDRAFT_28373 [Dictyostelium purpureum]|uniref:Mitochondrial chaperone BCS1 n=1 Tax=Dictyostelium purpureum TaxID=5786 RepID=F0ZBU1_DICPU|nr:uncharacterized protein DICPUDRAFT_28373 [Dictyostelium purpureum]EGC38598.1 hypothetical protein DICPUDRAFT_28373 [Dictyostelium purpureum]|eukprot:XP_003284877.1 hypothetical protein DICPUDRAFT_28373 [Dictyostelium purpureum]